jgi:hypothetical protein
LPASVKKKFQDKISILQKNTERMGRNIMGMSETSRFPFAAPAYQEVTLRLLFKNLTAAKAPARLSAASFRFSSTVPRHGQIVQCVSVKNQINYVISNSFSPN